MSKVLMLGKIEGQKQRRVAEDEMLDSITDSMDMNLGKFQETVRDREALVQVSSAAQSCPTLRDPTDRSTPGLPVYHQLPEFTETHVH